MKTSAAGRFQLSAEKAYSVSAVTPRSGAAVTTRRTASAPARWPAPRARPRRVAQRPLPSMMIATCREVLCFIKQILKKKSVSTRAGGADQRLHVVEIALQGAPSMRGQTVLGLGHAPGERLHARHVLRLLELAGVHAQVAVGRVQKALQLVERETLVHRERADDREAHALVDQPIELGGGARLGCDLGTLHRPLRIIVWCPCCIGFSH